MCKISPKMDDFRTHLIGILMHTVLFISPNLPKTVASDLTFHSQEYEFTFIDESFTWEEGRDRCAKDGGYLVQIDSEEISSIIQASLQHWPTLWIGANDRDNEGVWIWLDGSDASRKSGYTGWVDPEPNDQGGEDCAEARSVSRWNDNDCNLHWPIICQKDILPIVQQGNHTFHFVTDEHANFDQARSDCQSRGMRLVEIYDEATNIFLQDSIKHPSDRMFCGGKKDVTSEYGIIWGSGGIPTYASGWANGEPNSTNLLCITLTIEGWKESDCDGEYAYICETLAATKDVTVSPNEETVDALNTSKVICQADGIPFPQVTWLDKIGKPVPLSQVAANIYQERPANANAQSILHLLNPTLEDEGTYNCSAINTMGNESYLASKVVRVLAPSTPNYLILKVIDCSSNVFIKWMPNPRAINIIHRINITSQGHNETMYMFPTDDEPQIERVTLKSWTKYLITVTPCPDDNECKENYAIGNTTSTEGLPDEVETVALLKSESYSCSVTWSTPIGVPNHMLTGFKVIINETINDVAQDGTAKFTVKEIHVDGDTSEYVFQGKPNRVYLAGIRAETCAGFGDLKWASGSCFFESEGSQHIGTIFNPAWNCNEIKQHYQSINNGLYYLKDTEGKVFQTYCDMEVGGGGWTLVASIHENNLDGRCTAGDRWSSEQGNSPKHPHGDGLWENRATYGTPNSATSDDYKNPAYFNMNARDVMIWHVMNDEPMAHLQNKAFLKYYTRTGFLSKYGGNLGTLFSHHYKMRSKEYQTYVDNGPAIPVKWHTGSDEFMMSLITPSLRNVVVPGYIQLRVVNTERNAFALCPGIKVNNMKDVEHVCIGSTSYNIGHYDEEKYCGDFAALDWPGHEADQRLLDSVVMIFYK